MLFNLFGYQLTLSYLQKASSSVLEAKLDKKEYSSDELLSVKTKLNLPYYSSSTRFERAYGSVSINGQEYEYVQKRVYNDTLELLCLPNPVKTKLKDAGKELAKSASGSESVPQKSVVKPLILECCTAQGLVFHASLFNQLATYAFQIEHSATPGYVHANELPPDVV